MNHRTARLPLACLALLLALAGRAAFAREAPATTRPATAPAAATAFLRFAEDGRGGGTLDTAIATYRNADGVEVHLVAALHVGEASYYEALSDTFDTYDVLLYELIKPRDGPVPGEQVAVRPARGDERANGAAAVGGLQAMMKNVLKLEFQLDAINYDRPNFVHADLDAETFNAMQAKRGESMFGLMLRSMVQEMKRQRSGKGAKPITSFDLLAAMASPDSARQYKLLLARQFEDLEAKIAGFEGDEGSVLITERNKAALRVLRKRIERGDRNIGVFYGAGHMPGIERELVDKLGFRFKGAEWRVAWDMREGVAGQQPK